MDVAVLTLTRDRLPYTQHCFATLRRNAGRPFDHFVLDQASCDGTETWLYGQHMLGELAGVSYQDVNIGCTRGWNALLEDLCDPAEYDVIVTFDNDCEVLTEDILKVAELAAEHEVILAPRVRGLMHPPPAIAHFTLGEHTVEETTILGNIFMAIPSSLLIRDFRWDERYAVWDGGESVTQWWRDRGGRCGYVEGYEVNHYKTTLGQVADIPWYFERRVAEGGRAR